MAVWIYGISHVWSCLTNCEETVRCDADLIDDSCEALKDLSNGVFRMSLSTFWGELWLFEYMGVIYTCVSCLTNCEKTVRCDADLIDDSCEALKDLSNGVFRMSLSTFWGELWLFEYMGDISHVWSCLTNCEKTVRCDADLIDDSCEALKDLSNGVFRMSLSTFWGELWLFEYMGVISHVWSCLTNCEKTVRCDADLIDDSCEALKDLSNGVFRMSLSTFWGELWLFEYMVIYTCVELPH